MIQPPTHGLGCNVGTLVMSNTVLKKPILKKGIQDTRLTMLSLTVTHECATW